MMDIAYYMPLYLKQKAYITGNQELIDYCEIFKVVGENACLIDRTGSISTPFKTIDLNPIPPMSNSVKDFGELCIERAEEIIKDGRPIYLMYSGGLDSTCVLVALHEAFERLGGFKSQLTIVTSLDGIDENPIAWSKLILPNYKIMGTLDMLADISINNCRYVQGENSDQIFGSDRILINAPMVTKPFNSDNLKDYLNEKLSRPAIIEKLHYEFMVLASKCPQRIEFMRDFLWWVNFTCKWQGTALRTLCFTNVFSDDTRISLDQAKNFETFFNTNNFQQLAISGKLDRWGLDLDPKTFIYNYKNDARKFIHKMQPDWSVYTQTKIKVGSLGRIIRHHKFTTDVIGFENNQLFASEIKI